MPTADSGSTRAGLGLLLKAAPLASLDLRRELPARTAAVLSELAAIKLLQRGVNAGPEPPQLIVT